MTVVVKFGSSLIAGRGGSVRRSVLRRRAREIAAIVGGGEPVAVVSSGAIALGLPHLRRACSESGSRRSGRTAFTRRRSS
jgi:glutamate 5-kinase